MHLLQVSDRWSESLPGAQGATLDKAPFHRRAAPAHTHSELSPCAHSFGMGRKPKS